MKVIKITGVSKLLFFTSKHIQCINIIEKVISLSLFTQRSETRIERTGNRTEHLLRM